ncbi:MAG: CotH kinase family protein [Bacilli bacterium]
MKNKKLLLMLPLFALLTSCNISDIFGNKEDDTTIDNGDDGNIDSGKEDPTEPEIETPQERAKILSPSFDVPHRSSINEFTYDDLFNLGNTVDIKVSVSDEELEKLQSDYETGYKSDIYRLADLVTINVTNYGNTYTWEFENVGIRQKGNTSRQNIFDSEKKLNLNHFKLSFDETFDDPEYYDAEFIAAHAAPLNADREFLGLTTIDLKWDKNNDNTHIREAYANYLYRACGIIVQHVGLSTFSIVQKDQSNKETSFGLCMLYEAANKSLIKRSLKDDVGYINMASWKEEKAGTYGISGVNYGDLYKASYGVGEGSATPNMSNDSISGKRVGVANISGSYIPAYDRKTNKDVDYDDNLFKTMINTINNKSYSYIDEVVDLEYFAISEAVGYYVGNPDALRYNYNNYMVYIRRTDGKAVIIPIDSDRCFGIIKDWNVKDGMKNEEVFSKDTSNGTQENNLLLKTILASSTNDCKTTYSEYIKLIAESDWVKTSTFDTYVDLAKASYSGYEFSTSEAGDNITFSNYMSAKLTAAAKSGLLGESSGGSEETENPGESEEVEETIYDNLYISGTFTDWTTDSTKISAYKMTRTAAYTYEITLVINSGIDSSGVIKFKFNNGTGWDQIDWTIEDGKLLMEKGGNFELSGVTQGDTLHVVINVQTLDATVTLS